MKAAEADVVAAGGSSGTCVLPLRETLRRRLFALRDEAPFSQMVKARQEWSAEWSASAGGLRLERQKRYEAVRIGLRLACTTPEASSRVSSAHVYAVSAWLSVSLERQAEAGDRDWQARSPATPTDHMPLLYETRCNAR